MLDLSLIQTVIAQAPENPDAPPGGILSFLPPLIIMFLIFYFVLIKPEQKKQAQARKMVENLKEGDNIITLSGIHGTIKKLKEDVVTLQIADNVRIKVERSSIGKIKSSGGSADGTKE